jgi:AcrR family transcriptional regulator
MSSSESTRRRLVEAAAAVFAERGYDGAGVAEIARRAGLTTGAIYSQFDGKADLLVAAIDLAAAEQMHLLFHGDGERAADVMAALGTHLVTPTALPHQALRREAFVAARRDPELARRLRHHIEDQDARLGKLVDEAKREGSVDRSIDTQAIVTFCHSVALGVLLYRAIARPLPSAAVWQQVIDRLVVAALPHRGGPAIGSRLPGGGDGEYDSFPETAV